MPPKGCNADPAMDSKVNECPPLPWLMPPGSPDVADTADATYPTEIADPDPSSSPDSDADGDIHSDDEAEPEPDQDTEADAEPKPEADAEADAGREADTDTPSREESPAPPANLGEQLTRAWRRLPKRQKVLGAICLFNGVVVAMIIVAPLMLPADSVDFGDEGLVTGNDFAQQREAAGMAGWVDFIYWMGDLNCHQKHSRTYELKGNQMPFCVRDLAIFTGLLVGMLLFFRRSHPLPFIAIVAGLVPLAMDGGTQLVTSYESTNNMRLLTGMVTGVTLGMVIAHIGTDISYSRTLRKAWEEGKPFVKPPPEMPRRYYHVFIGMIVASCWMTALNIGWQALS